MKTKIFILVGLLIAAFALAMSASAQDAESPCVVADVLAPEYKGIVEGEWLKMVITTLNANIEDNDTPNFLGTIRELRRVLARLEANCRGLHFTSEQEGLKPVLGPLSMPAGIWRATFTTEGSGAVRPTTISGDCGLDLSIFNESAGDATNGTQSVLEIGEGCEFLLEVSNTREPWDLVFELVKAG